MSAALYTLYIFINWLLTKEGQTLLARVQVSPSWRTDVPTEGLDPLFLPQPGEKIDVVDEEMTEFLTGPFAKRVTEVVKEAQQ